VFSIIDQVILLGFIAIKRLKGSLLGIDPHFFIGSFPICPIITPQKKNCTAITLQGLVLARK